MEKRKWIVQLVLVLLVSLTLESLGAFFPPPLNIGIQTVEATPTPSIVGQTTSDIATIYPLQRKGFYASGRFWLAYGNGSHRIYRSSLDGISWSDETIIYSGSSGAGFSLDYNQTHIAVVTYYAGQCHYRLGVPTSDGTISWSASNQTVDSNIVGNGPSTCFDTDGYPYIGYVREYSGSYYPQITKSSERNGTWVTASGFPYNLTTAISNLNWFVSVVPLTSGRVYAIYTLTDNTIKGKLWNGTAWEDEETVSSSTIKGGFYHSLVTQGDDVHLVFLKQTTYDIIYLKRTYESGWGNEVTVQSSASGTSAPALSINTANNVLYCFWAGSPIANHIYYKKCVSGTWDSSPTDWIDESTEQLTSNNRLTVFYKSYENKIGLAYSTKTASPYNVKFDYFDVSPTIDEFSTSLYTVYADTYFLLNATINDVDGLTDFVNATLEISNSVILKWVNSTNTFSIYSDPNAYCTLDAEGSTSAQINSTAYHLCWKIKLSSSYPIGSVSVVATNTKVFDNGGLSGSNSYSDLFYFEGTQPSNTDLPSIIGRSNAGYGPFGIFSHNRRKSFYSSGRFWVFYTDGANLVYKTSMDGLNWSIATKIGACTSGARFSIFFNDTHIHYARYDGDSKDLFYRMGGPNSDGSVTWSVSEQTVYDGNSTNLHCQPNIAVDSEGYPWIGTLWWDGVEETGTGYPYIFKSSLNNGTWTTQTGFPHQLSTTSFLRWRVTPIPLTEGKLYTVYSQEADKLKGKLWDGSNWGNEETITTSYVYTGGCVSAVNEGNNIHLVFFDNATLMNIHYVKRTYGVGWSGETLVQASIDAGQQINEGPVLSIDSTSNTLYVFWSMTGTWDLSYKRCIGGTWDSNPTDWIDAIQFPNPNQLNGFYKSYNNKIIILYNSNVTASGCVKFSGFNVYFEKYLLEAPLDLAASSLKYDSATSQLSFTASATGTRTIKIKAEKPYYVKIDETVYSEGNKWVYDGTHGIIIITDTFSTKNIVVSWASLAPPEPAPPPPPSGEGPPTAPEWAKPIVEEVVKPMVLAIPKFYVGLFIIGLILVGASLAHSYDDETITALCIIVMVVIAVDLLFVWVLKPVGLMPADLRFLEPLLWEPPTLSLEVFGLPSEQTLIVQGVLMISLIVMFVVAVVLVAGEE